MGIPHGMARKAYLIITIIITIPALLFSYYDALSCKGLLMEKKEKQLLEASWTLASKMSFSFEEILRKEDAEHLTPEGQAKILHRNLQPLVTEICQSYPHIGLSIYSLEAGRRIAVGPDFHSGLMIKLDDSKIERVYQTGKFAAVQVKHSITWNGKPALAVVYPIYYKGKIVGHTAGYAKTEDIQRDFYLLMAKRVIVILLVWIAIVAALFWIFRRFHSSLSALALQIRNEDDNPGNFSDFPELLPVLETTISLRDCLKRKNNVLKWMLKNIPGGFLAIDNDRKIAFANPSVYGVLGLDKEKEDLAGQDINHLISIIGNSEQEKVPLLKALEDGTTVCRQKVIGKDKCYQFDASPMLDPETGKIIGAAAYFHDITQEEEKNKELEELRLSYLNQAERLQQLIDATPLAITAVDSQERLTVLNKAALSYHPPGKREELMGQPFKLVAEVLDLSYNQSALIRTLKGEKIQNQEFSVFDRQFMVNAYQIKDVKTQELLGAVAILEDITVRKQTENKIREQGEMLDLARNYIFVWDMTEKITFWNQGAERGYGWGKREALGKSPYELLKTQFPKPLEEIRAEVLSKGYWEGILIHTRRDGKEITVESTLSLKWDELGNPEAILEIDNDITQLREEQEKEQQATIRWLNEAQKLNQLIEICPIAIVAVDHQGRISSVNQALLDVMPIFQREDLIGQPCKVITEYLGQEDEHVPITRALKGEKVKDYLSEMLGREWLCHALPIEDADTGKIIGAISLYHDITEHEELRKEMGRLDRLNLIGEMAAGVAHEIRNPMAAARGYLQLLMAKSGAESQRHFKIIIEELDRANSIITDFLSLARNKPSDGKKQNLNEIITSIYPLIYGDAMKQGVSAKLKLAEELPMAYFNDKEIKQLILNLSRNAIEAMGQKGRLTIETRDKDSKLQLIIADTGCGIPQQRLKKIFNPFYTTKESGTGLGLAVCLGIIERHKGNIEVESSEGRGTTFTITFCPDESSQKNMVG